MRDNSIAIFEIDGAPVFTVSERPCGARLTLSDSQDGKFGQAVDVYARNEDADRLRRAAEAFNAIMREPVAQAAE